MKINECMTREVHIADPAIRSSAPHAPWPISTPASFPWARMTV